MSVGVLCEPSFGAMHDVEDALIVELYLSVCPPSLSLRFNGHFPDEPRLAGVY